MHFLAVFTIVFSMLLGENAHALSPDFLALSEKPFWIRLGHYEKSTLGKLFGTWRSGIDGDAFFISPAGKTSPRAELEATWRALEENAQLKFKTPWGEVEGKARCFFPARAALLERETAHAFPKPLCSDYDTWMKKISGKSVSLIFSSYFSGAPASMFGHSFLRISKSKDSRNPLLDMAVDFSAQTQAENRVVEAFKGLFGFYPGRYGIWPYYVKVKEYNNSENRDLFEYPLDFNADETEILLAHVWELSYSHSDYYFFHRNCSYQLLTVLEVAKPNWKVDAYRVYAVPIDTIRDVLKQPGQASADFTKTMIAPVTYRQSLSARLERAYDRLTPQDQKLYDGYAHDAFQFAPFAVHIQSAPLAEALALHYLVKQMQHQGELPKHLRERHRELLVRRAALGTSQASDEQDLKQSNVKDPISPEQGHPTSMVAVGGKFSRQRGDAITLKWRPALHDLLNDDSGYNPYSRLEIFSTEISYRPESKRLALEKLTALAITSLNPSHPTRFKWSYLWDVYGEQARGLGCTDCLLWGMSAGVGASTGFPSVDHGLIYSMVVVETQIANALERGWRFGPGLAFGGVWNLSHWGKLLLQETAQVWALDQGSITSKSELGFSVFPTFGKLREWEFRTLGSVLHSLNGKKDLDSSLQFTLTRFF